MKDEEIIYEKNITYTLEPKITNLEEINDTLKFTISNINVSHVNAIRRVLLSDIPIIGIKTSPYTENKLNIIVNKTRLNNELIKQRISSIPIHIDDIDTFPINDYMIEMDKINNSNTIIYATTEDFKIKNINTNKYLLESEVKKIFPPDPITGDYIDIVRLRPKIVDNINSEQIKLNATLSICHAKDDGVFNVVSTCSYGNTLDPLKIKEEWKKKEESFKNKYSKEEIEFLKKDWLLLDAKRLYIEDSFDFVLETIGIYSNFKLMELAASIIIKKLYVFLESLKMNTDLIKEAVDTLENCYIIVIENEDYTIGKIIEYYLFVNLFLDKKDINYVGFLKKHPHDINSFIKISYKLPISKDEIILNIENAVNASILLFNSIKKYFTN